MQPDHKNSSSFKYHNRIGVILRAKLIAGTSDKSIEREKNRVCETAYHFFDCVTSEI